MPQGDERGRMHRFQLWANLPSSLKMTSPRYQDIAATDMPEVIGDDGTRVRVVCGNFWGKTGPVDGVASDSRCLDVSVPPGHRARLPVDRAQQVFAYVFAGSGSFRDASTPLNVATESVSPAGHAGDERVSNRSLVLFDAGDEVSVQSGGDGIRFLLVSGKTDRGTGRVARTHRHEHRGGAAPRVQRAAGRELHRDAVTGTTHGATPSFIRCRSRT